MVSMEYVTVNGKPVKIESHKLDLSCMHIEQLSQIKGPYIGPQKLLKPAPLESLDLSHNRLGPGIPIRLRPWIGSIRLGCDGLIKSLPKPKMSLLPFQYREWCFKLKHLDLSFNGIEHLNGIETLHNLESLDISHNKLAVWNELEVLYSLPHLKVLHIEGNRPYKFNPSHNKRWWRVGGKFTTIPPLEIPQNLIKDENLKSAIQAGDQAVDRHVFNFATQSRAYDTFRCETVVKNNTLDLRDFEIGIAEPIEDCMNLESPKIQKLLLSNSYTFGKHFIGFEDVHSNLLLLDLSHNGLTKITNRRHNEAPYLPNLKILDLSHNNLPSFNAISLSLPNLEELNVSFNQIRSFEGIKKFPSLQWINIYNNSTSHLLDGDDPVNWIHPTQIPDVSQ